MTTKKSTKTDVAKSEVRISVSDQAREITVELASEREEVLKTIKDAISKNVPLVLSDIRGRQFVIPAAKISSVEIGESAERRVGQASRGGTDAASCSAHASIAAAIRSIRAVASAITSSSSSMTVDARCNRAATLGASPNNRHSSSVSAPLSAPRPGPDCVS